MAFSAFDSQLEFLTHDISASCCGKARIEDAKITGMTPPALTFSGMWVDCPPMTRRPTTRLAYCTGMRRSPRSTRTMNATTATIIDQQHDQVDRAPLVGDEHVPVDVLDGVRQPHHDSGEDDQRHAVADAALADLLAQPHDERRPGGQRKNRQHHEPEARVDDNALLHRHQALRDTERLQNRKDDGQVAGPLGDLAPPELAFLLQFFERGHHDGHQLQDDRRRDVRHDAEREDRQAADIAAREQVEEAEDRALLATRKTPPTAAC